VTTTSAYYRRLLLDALYGSGAPLTLVDLVDRANEVGMAGGATPADLAGLSGRVANTMLRGMLSDGLVARVQPPKDAPASLHYALTDHARATLSAPLHARTAPPPPFPRPVSMDMDAVRRASTQSRSKALQRQQQRRVDAFCREFMDDCAGLINRFTQDAEALRAKYQRLYRELRGGQ
jgi:hypothetical protein